MVLFDETITLKFQTLILMILHLSLIAGAMAARWPQWPATDTTVNCVMISISVRTVSKVTAATNILSTESPSQVIFLFFRLITIVHPFLCTWFQHYGQKKSIHKDTNVCCWFFYSIYIFVSSSLILIYIIQTHLHIYVNIFSFLRSVVNYISCFLLRLVQTFQQPIG